MEMAEQDLCEGRSSVAVHHCIRQLSYCRRDIRDSAGVWGEVSVTVHTLSFWKINSVWACTVWHLTALQFSNSVFISLIVDPFSQGKGMLLVLQDRMLNLIDPDDHSLLHSQPISSIRVWGVGRDHERSVGTARKQDCESFVATGSEHSSYVTCVMMAGMRCKHDPGCRNT